MFNPANNRSMKRDIDDLYITTLSLLKIPGYYYYHIFDTDEGIVLYTPIEYSTYSLLFNYV